MVGPETTMAAAADRAVASATEDSGETLNDGVYGGTEERQNGEDFCYNSCTLAEDKATARVRTTALKDFILK